MESSRLKKLDNGNGSAQAKAIDAIQQLLSTLKSELWEDNVRSCNVECQSEEGSPTNVQEGSPMMAAKGSNKNDEYEGHKEVENAHKDLHQSAFPDVQGMGADISHFLGKTKTKGNLHTSETHHLEHVQECNVSPGKSSRKHEVFNLFEKVARQGESILKDERFLQLCSKFLKLDDDVVPTSEEEQDGNNTQTAGIMKLHKAADSELKAMEKASKGSSDMEENRQEDVSVEKATSFQPLDKNPAVKGASPVNSSVHASAGQKSSSFSDIGDIGTVHDMQKACKVQPSVTFADIAKNGLNKSVNVGHPRTCHAITNSCNTAHSSLLPSDASPLHVGHPEKRTCPCSHFKIQNNVSTSLLADGKDQEGRLSSEDTPNPSKGNRNHVTTSKPLNYLEAAKHVLNKSTAHTLVNGNEDKWVSASHVSPPFLEGAQLTDMTKEEGSRVMVPTETLQRRIELCKFSIIGRVILAKGEKVWPTKKLRENLNEVWNFNSSWRLICLGKGYFHLLLTSQEEYEKVWTRGAINLKPGIMRLQKWVFGFDPTKEKSSNAQVWFRFYNLPWCLWDVSILTALSRKIGSPIRLDNNTFNGDFGHYARVLIDVDLSKTIKEVLQLDCGTNIFDVKVVPENIPHFCSACSNIGHTSNDCRMIRKMVNEAKVTDDCKVDKADLAIKHRFEVHKNQRKGIKSLRHNLQESADQGSKALNLTEPITDFGAQRGIQGTKDNHTDDIFVSNKFSALDEMEDIGTCDATKGTNKRNDRKLTKENNVEEQRTEEQKMEALKLIREWVDTIKEDKDFGKMIEEYNKEDDPETSTPNPSKRWSDMIDEEDENQFVPLNVQANGEDMEVNMKTFKISPISKRKNKKQIG